MASNARCVTDPPVVGQVVQHAGKRYITVQEGRAFILVPDSTKDAGEQKDPRNKDGPVQSVFYNPIQQFNRDLTILAIKAYGEDVVDRKNKCRQAKKELYAGKKRKRLAALAAAESNKASKADDLSSPRASKYTAEAAQGDQQQSDKQSVLLEVEDFIQEVRREMEQASGRGTSHEPRSGQDDRRMEDPTAADSVNGQTRYSDFKPRFTILDALSATGLRALRYAHEIPFVTRVTSNDLVASAVESINLNVLHNKLGYKIDVTHSDALVHMYARMAAHLALTDQDKAKGKSGKYDVIDLDPYGTASTFLDAAVQAVRDDGGLLCVTCTDAGVWASNGYPEKAFALYGGIPIKGQHSHEVGLRLILHAIATSAARYGLTIEPLLSLSIDFYARIFVKIRRSPAAVKFAAGKTMIMYNCDAGCGAWSTQLLLKNRAHPNKKATGSFYKHQMAQGPTSDQTCKHCGFRTHLAGPMYAGRLHSPEFIKRILDKLPEADTTVYGTTERIKGMLTTALEEYLEDMETQGKSKSKEDSLAEIEPYPFFFLAQELARKVHCATPSEIVLHSALRSLGYRVTRSHCKPGSIKTDAPWSVIWDVFREWIKQKAPVKEANIKPGSPGFRILGLKTDELQQAGDLKANGIPAEGEEGTGVENSAKGDQEKREVVFDKTFGLETNKEKLVRYQMNPRENWGPMNRAKGQ